MWLKDKLYHLLVERNEGIRVAYQGRINADPEYHRRHRLRSWMYMIGLNVKHGLFRMKFPQKPSEIAADTKKQANNTKNNKKTSNDTKKTSNDTKKTSNDIKKSANNTKNNKADLKKSESASVKRATAYFYAKNLLNFEMISFNVFGTLLLSPFSNQYDIFRLVEAKLGYAGFAEIRKGAESKARELKGVFEGNREVTIHDIYKVVEELTGIDAAYGVKMEYQVITDTTMSNPYIRRVCKLLKGQGREIVAVADTYLTKEMVSSLLNHCGCTFFTELFVSNNYGYTRASGHLFTTLKRKYESKYKLIHVGQDHAVDVEKARKMGLDSLYYPCVHELGNQYRVKGMMQPVSAAYSGIVNVHLHNGIKQYSPQYEYGFIYGGIYILGFCNWVYWYAKKNAIDKVVFLSSNSDFVENVFRSSFPDVCSRFAYWSDKFGPKFSLEANREVYINEFVCKPVLASKNVVTFHDALVSIGASGLLETMEAENINGCSILGRHNIDQLKLFLSRHWTFLKSVYDCERSIARRYLESIGIDNDTRLLLVDADLFGKCSLGIKALFRDEFEGLGKAVTLLLASEYADYTIEEQSSYLFSKSHNRNIYRGVVGENRSAKELCIQLFTQNAYELYSFSQDGIFNFHIPAVENFYALKEVRDGILDFMQMYRRIFNAYPQLMNISACDAFLPFMSIAKEMKYMDNHFNNLKIRRGMFGEAYLQRMVSLRSEIKAVSK